MSGRHGIPAWPMESQIEELGPLTGGATRAAAPAADRPWSRVGGREQ